ncbi:MAG TPA: hypothetical protein VER96_35415 [Polyangiaceae bacterium]|nr:hypothetical protein [Polyangiaceae bacterium]
MDQANLAAVTVHVLLVTAVLLTLPVFCAESWLLICRLTRRNDARRFAVPFAATSAGSALLAFWLAHQVDLRSYLVAI